MPEQSNSSHLSLTSAPRGLNLKPPDLLLPLPSPKKCVAAHNRLQEIIRGEWPIGLSLLRKHDIEALPLTIIQSAVYRKYAQEQDPSELFRKASAWLTNIRKLGFDDKKGEIMEEDLLGSVFHAIFGSNAIESAGHGLELTLHLCTRVFQGEDVEDFDQRTADYDERLKEMIEIQKDLKEKSGQDIIRGRREIVQHAKAFYYIIHEIVFEGKPLTEELIKATHSILCEGVSIPHQDGSETSHTKYAGIYRKMEVRAGNTMFVPPRMVPGAMERFVKTYNDDMDNIESTRQLDPFDLASKYCLEFVMIHPFQDGNGRMCRMILNALLCRFTGVVIPIGEHEEERKEYLDIKKRASEHMEGHGEFAVFVLKKAATRLRSVKQKLAGKASQRSR